MKRTVKKVETSKFEVTSTLEKAAWKEAQDKAFKELAKNVEIKGFRKGQAPEQMVKSKINQGEIFNKAIDSVLNDMFTDVVENEKLMPFTQPSVNVTKVSTDELEVVFTIICAPEVELGTYKGLHADKKEVKVEDKEIDDEINVLLAQNATLSVVDREAKLHDTVMIDFEGFVDGKAFEGGKAENFALELGSGQFIPGFEDQLVGTKAGEDKDVNVKFPENYVENLKGKDATFKVKVHEVKEKKIPELNDEFVADLGRNNIKTVEDLKNDVKTNIVNKKTEASNNEYFNELLKQIREGSKVELAKEIIDNEVAAMKDNMVKKMSEQGLTMEQYLQITNTKMEDLDANLSKDAVVNIKNSLVLNKIGEVENITVTDADIEFEMAKIADQYKMELAKVKEILEPNKGNFAADIKFRRIHDFILEQNN